jgi:hypothetical protein
MKAAVRHLVAFMMGLGWLLTAGRSSAWVETHLMSHDVRIEVDRSGSAVVDHAIVMRVRGGGLRSFDLVGGDQDAVALPDSTVMPAQTEASAEPLPLEISPRPEGGLRVTIDSPKGVRHGAFLFHVRYQKNLLASSVRREGAMLRIGWTGPTWQEGLDTARCTFVLPAAPTEPRAGNDPAGSDNDVEPESTNALITEVRRSADRDEVELVRPHVARGEAVTWSVRVDPRALGDANRAEPATASPPTHAASQRPPEQQAQFIGLVMALAAIFSTLVALKARQVARAAFAAQSCPRPLIPVGSTLRSILGGPALAAGVALQIRLDDPLWGTLAVLLAMALTAYLPPRHKAQPRGPGQWFLLTDTEAFRRDDAAPGGFLDAGTMTGKALLALSVLCVAASALAMWPVSTFGSHLIVLDSAVLFALFGTGSTRQLPPDPLCGPAPLLARIARSLRKSQGLRAIGWARLPYGSDRFDELRLVVAPRLPRRGFSGIEVGFTAAPGMGGYVQTPEVLVRVIDASPCHEAFRRLVPGARWIRGRKADERVAAFRPHLPTVQMATALARRLAQHAREQPPAEPPTSAKPRVAAAA